MLSSQRARRQLSATQIADVMKILRAQKVDKGAIIARRGEPAHSMYLIVDGEVEIRLHHRHVRLCAGDFFGEIAALRQSRRSSTVQALQPTRLLALDAADLHSLMDREPQIASRIWKRRAQGWATSWTRPPAICSMSNCTPQTPPA